jgi:hypothetical protein
VLKRDYWVASWVMARDELRPKPAALGCSIVLAPFK